MCRVSIIVPAYNVEKHIKRCIRSILNQTLNDIEVIIIDDGSMDHTYDLCKSMDDARINIIRQNNSGAAAARNRGLEAATGEFIGFVDGDDYIEPNMYELLYSIAKETNADIVNGSYFMEKDGCTSFAATNRIEQPEVKLYSKMQMKDVIRHANEEKTLWFAWKGIYSRRMIEENSIRIPVDLVLGEETPFVLECLLCAHKMATVDTKLYHYIQRQGSLTKTKHKNGYFEKLNKLYEEKKEVYQRHDFKNYENDLNKYTMLHTIPMILSNELEGGKSLSEQRRVFKTMRNSDMVSSAFKTCSPYSISSKLKYMAVLLKYRQYTILSLLCKLFFIYAI